MLSTCRVFVAVGSRQQSAGSAADILPYSITTTSLERVTPGQLQQQGGQYEHTATAAVPHYITLYDELMQEQNYYNLNRPPSSTDTDTDDAAAAVSNNSTISTRPAAVVVYAGSTGIDFMY